jgi:glutamate dehydrogenase
MLDSTGEICGFGKILGLLTHKALRTPNSEIPLLRERRIQVLDRIDAATGSHDYKAAMQAYDSLPVEFLFSFDTDEICKAVRRIMAGTHSGRVEVFAVPDFFNRAFFVSVVLPRSNYDETLHDELRGLLTSRFGATYVDSRSSFVDDASALLHLFGSAARDIDPEVLPELERQVQACAESWDDRFERALLEAEPPARAYELVETWATALPHEYRAITPAHEAVRDVLYLEQLHDNEDPVELAIFDEPAGSTSTSRLKLYLRDRPFLTDLLPVIDHFGIQVVDATLTEVPATGRQPSWIVTFRIVRVAREPYALSETRRRALDGLRAVLAGRIEDDSLNRLVIGAKLEWREVEMLRAYLAYAAQLGRAPEWRQASDVLLAHPGATRALVVWFRARFDPTLTRPRDTAEREAEEALASERVPIRNASVDRVFAGIASLIRATTRTNYFMSGAEAHCALAFKIDPSRLERSTPPVPFAEIFVYAADWLGVHLRGGPLARGGIRWKGAAPRPRRRVPRRTNAMPASCVCCSRSPTTRSRTGWSLRQTWCDTTGTIPTWWSRPTAGPRTSPTWRTAWPPSAASGSTTPSPAAARTASITRRRASRPAVPGSAPGATSSSAGSTSSATRSAWPESATCRATCSATACC